MDLCTSTSGGISSPSFALLGMEPLRAALEYAGMHFMSRDELPAGDGHPVVIFPGLASNEQAVKPLRSFCEELGYAAYDWGRGYNVGPQGDIDAWLDELATHVDQLTAAHEAPITLIGWSLGGIYAREVAKRLAPRVRQVITIGTPFAGSAEHTNAVFIYRLLNGHPPPAGEALAARLQTPPGVPTTSIYSRSDGIVAWQACIQEGAGDQAENIEIHGSHCGMGWNSEVFKIIADRLVQPLKGWQPFQA